MTYKYNPIEDCYATKKKIYIFRNEIEGYYKARKKLSLLDFGCGNANDCGKYIINRLYHYNGVDIHKKSLEYAKNQFGNKNVKFTSEPIKKKYDIIIISEVLEHLKDPEGTLKFLFSLLKDDGIILGSIPNGYGLTEIEKYIIHKFGIYKISRFIYRLFKKKENTKNQIPFNYESGHIQHFTISSFKGIVDKSGFYSEYIKNGSLMGADITGSTIFKLNFTKYLNTKIADFLPSTICATWIFKLTKQK